MTKGKSNSKKEDLVVRKVRIYPTLKQQKLIEQWESQGRRLWNACVEYHHHLGSRYSEIRQAKGKLVDQTNLRHVIGKVKPQKKGKKTLEWGYGKADNPISPEMYEQHAPKPNHFSMCRDLKPLRAEDADLASVPCAIQQYLLLRFCQARKRVMDDRTKGKPADLRKKHYPQTAPMGIAVGDPKDIVSRRGEGKALNIKFPKLGKILARGYTIEDMVGTVKSLSITKTADKYYCSVLLDTKNTGVTLPTQHANPGTKVGLDWGTTVLIADSKGGMNENPKTFKTLGARIEHLQRRRAMAVKIPMVSKDGIPVLTKKGNQRTTVSKRALKIQKSLRRVHARVARERDRHQHEIVNRYVPYYEKIGAEDLSVKNMTGSAKGTKDQPGKMVKQKAGLNKSILDTAPAALLTKFAYKTIRYGGTFTKFNPAYTSQTCSCCGHVDSSSRQSQALFLCTSCGFTLNADTNAAINIENKL